MFFNAMLQRLTSKNFVYISSAITNLIQKPISFQLNINAMNFTGHDYYFHCKVWYAFSWIFAKHLKACA